MNMRLQVKQWGNSKAIRLPKDFTNAMNLNMGDFLELEKFIEGKNMINSIAKILVETAKSHPKETLIAVITIVALVTIKENYGHAPKDPALFQRD